MAEQKWTKALEEKLLERLLEGQALNAICRNDDIPVCESYVRKRARDDTEFGAKYARAREIGYQCRAEKCVEDAKDAADAALGRLAFDAERWYLGKMQPTVFGDKTLLGFDPDNPLPSGFIVRLHDSSDE